MASPVRTSLGSFTRLTRLALRLVPLLLMPLWLLPEPAEAQVVYDVIIRGGRVLDGSANPWFRADIAIDGDRIVAVGDLREATARREIDAQGLYVAPGFIDVHSHAGGGLAREELSHARPLLAQGITSVVVNPDGGGPVDLAEQRVELERDGLGVNVLQMVPHGTVRRRILGTEARAPSADELEMMRRLVRAGMEEGAWGLSSGTFYIPGAFADNAEIIELALVMAEYGGVYASHIRDESNYTIGVLAAVDEVIEVGREAGVPAVVTHIKALGPPVWGLGTAIVQRIERARAEGVEVYGDQYPYTASATSIDAALVPRWAQAGGPDSLQARLDRPEEAARIRTEMAANLSRRGGADRFQFRHVNWNESLEGRRLSEVAYDRGEDPLETALWISLQGGAGVVSFNMLEDDVRIIMSQPWTMTGSDGGLVPWMRGVPHPRSYGAFPEKIRRYVVEDEVIDLARAVHSMTGLNARVFRVPDRGELRVGARADVVVFDLDALSSPATYSHPHELAQGMEWVFVNGEAAIAEGESTGALAGRVLRKR